MGVVSSLPLLVILLLVWWIMRVSMARAAAADFDSASSSRLNAVLQDYAYRGFVRTRNPRTGVAYDATLPANLSGITVSAMRLRSGSLRKRGVSSFKQFDIPMGIVQLQHPYVERLVLVYHNLGNWSTLYYPLPHGTIYLTPVLGLLAYDASNLSANNLPQLNIRASDRPITVNFSHHIKSVNLPQGASASHPSPRCVFFDLQGGLLNFTKPLPDNVCSTFQQGHLSVVVESMAPPPLPAEGGGSGRSNDNNNNSNKSIRIIIGTVIGGGLVVLVLLGVLVVWAHNYKQSKKMQQMEKAADVGEPLHMTTIGSTRAPAAALTRTQHSLETEYVP